MNISNKEKYIISTIIVLIVSTMFVFNSYISSTYSSDNPFSYQYPLVVISSALGTLMPQGAFILFFSAAYTLSKIVAVESIEQISLLVSGLIPLVILLPIFLMIKVTRNMSKGKRIIYTYLIFAVISNLIMQVLSQNHLLIMPGVI